MPPSPTLTDPARAPMHPAEVACVKGCSRTFTGRVGGEHVQEPSVFVLRQGRGRRGQARRRPARARVVVGLRLEKLWAPIRIAAVAANCAIVVYLVALRLEARERA
jgi:hypothetical protein